MHRIGWYLVEALLSFFTMTQAVSAEGKRETRGDPKTTYDQEENAAHNSKGGGSAETMSASSQASVSSSSDTQSHWVVRQVKTSAGGRWTLYENGEVKRVDGL